jgi:hypothetical protein
VAGCGSAAGSDDASSPSTATTRARRSLDASQRALQRDQQALVDAWAPASERVNVVWAAYSLFVDGLAPATRLRSAVDESRTALVSVRQAVLRTDVDPALRGVRTHLLRASAARATALDAATRSDVARSKGQAAGAAQGLLDFAERWDVSLRETRLATTQLLALDASRRIDPVREDALR